MIEEDAAGVHRPSLDDYTGLAPLLCFRCGIWMGDSERYYYCNGGFHAYPHTPYQVHKIK